MIMLRMNTGLNYVCKALNRLEVVDEMFSAVTQEQKEEEDQRNVNRHKLFSKASNFNASSNAPETKQTQNDHC